MSRTLVFATATNTSRDIRILGKKLRNYFVYHQIEEYLRLPAELTYEINAISGPGTTSRVINIVTNSYDGNNLCVKKKYFHGQRIILYADNTNAPVTRPIRFRFR